MCKSPGLEVGNRPEAVKATLRLVKSVFFYTSSILGFICGRARPFTFVHAHARVCMNAHTHAP